MPEGHTIHRIATDHLKFLRGRPVAVSSPQGRFAAGAALVDGARLLNIEAHGKHLFYRWDNGLVGHVHLGLFGRFWVHRGSPSADAATVRMRLAVPKATIDLTGPTECAIGTLEDRDRILSRLGPDPLRDDADPQLAFSTIVRRAAPIGQLLLEQKVISGVGNVYRAEALFLTGIHPARSGRAISRTDFEQLWSTIVAMLRKGFAENRIVTIDPDELDFPSGPTRRGETTYVYHRDVCLRCGTPIRTIELGGRPCYFCPTCQPA
ncbi:MAG TPA: DNA-formamidopyrimidine glycosylase family protein [Ilumatobacteraceae bacterium]|nr:DNA-formamidopyrimidine glycosylase family protein [Ilumatobacteraceae bacterium]